MQETFTNYKRILIKLSGEYFSPNILGSIEKKAIKIINDFKTINNLGIQLAIVIGAGNILRGRDNNFGNLIERSTADSMGMLATMINSLALSDILTFYGIKNKILSSKGIEGMLQTSCPKLANSYLNKGNIVIFAGGTGNPFVTTDSTATLRAAEIKAEAILKITKVDGIYDKDPKINNNAKKFDKISFSDALNKELDIMDIGAFIQARDFNIPICVFNFKDTGTIIKVLNNEREGTWIKN